MRLFSLPSCVTLMFYACLPLIRVPTQVLKFFYKENVIEKPFSNVCQNDNFHGHVIYTAAYLGSIKPRHIINFNI